MTRFEMIKKTGIIEPNCTIEEFAELFTYDLDCGMCGVSEDYCNCIIYGDDYEKLTDSEKEERNLNNTCEKVMIAYLSEELPI